MVELKVTLTLEDLQKIVSEKVKEEFGTCMGELDFSAMKVRARNDRMSLDDIIGVDVVCNAGEEQ